MKKESGCSESTEVILSLRVIYEEDPLILLPSVVTLAQALKVAVHESRSTQQPIQTASLKKLALVASKFTLIQNTHSAYLKNVFEGFEG